MLLCLTLQITAMKLSTQTAAGFVGPCSISLNWVSLFIGYVWDHLETGLSQNTE